MDMNRRAFVEALAGVAGFAALGGCRGGKCCLFGGGPRMAVQLFSIHKIFFAKPEWCLEGLAAAGYEGVEFAGYGKNTAADLRRMLAAAGMRGMGTHVNGNVDLVGDGLKKTLDFCVEAGIESVTTPHAKRDSADEYRKFGYEMGLAAEAAAPLGIKVGVHTTYHHFTTKYGNETAWDMIFKEASPLLQQQIDTANAFHTGQDVVALLKKYAGRHHSVHLKENTPSKTGTLGERPTDGAACVPWDDVLKYLKTEDVGWYVVEAEAIPDSLVPLRDSLAFLRGKGA